MSTIQKRASEWVKNNVVLPVHCDIEYDDLISNLVDLLDKESNNEWIDINEYDKSKPSEKCVFYFEGEVNVRHPHWSLCETVELKRFFGNRTCTHFKVVGKP